MKCDDGSLLCHRVRAFLQHAWIAVPCLSSCSTQDFDRLTRGSSGAGGEATYASTGGIGLGTSAAGAGGVGTFTQTLTGDAGAAEWGSAGTAANGYGGVVNNSFGAASASDAGQPGASGSFGQGGTSGAAGASDCAPGAVGCPSASPSCGPRFVDCNGLASDGCETFLDGLTTCGSACANVVACQPSQVCNEGLCVAPQGLAKISVPLTATGQGQRYGYKFPTGTNLTKATIVFRMYAPGALDGLLNIYPTDVDRLYGTGVNAPLASASNGWLDVRIPMGDVTAAGAYNPSNMYQLTIEIRADGAGPWSNPTVVYLDGLWSSNGIVRETFEASLGPMVSSTLLFVEGSVISWFDSLGSDCVGCLSP